MKFGQSVEYNKRNLSFLKKNHGVNEVGRPVTDFFLYEIKANDMQLCFNFF